MQLMRMALLLVALAVFSATSAEARDKAVKFQRSDLELGLGMTFGASPDYYSGGAAPYLHLEYRYNLKVIPLDVGFQIARSVLRYSDDWDDVNRVDSYLFVSDYHFRAGQKHDWYAGFGLGWVSSDFSWKSEFGGTVRAGVKLWRHVNLSLAYKVQSKPNNHAVLGLGFFF